MCKTELPQIIGRLQFLRIKKHILLEIYSDFVMFIEWVTNILIKEQNRPLDDKNIHS